MALADHIQITITKASASVARAGFGVPLLMSCEAAAKSAFSSVYAKIYTSLADLADDGFSTTGELYKLAQRVLGQNPQISSILVGKRATPPSQQFELSLVGAAKNSYTYSVTINGVVVTYTSDSTATVAEIITNLVTNIEASSIAGAVVASAQSGNTVLRLIAQVLTAPIDVSIDRTIWNKLENHADAGIVADLHSIQHTAGGDNWYVVMTDTHGKAEIIALAAEIETLKRVFAAESADYDVLTGSTTDVMSSLKGSSYDRTFLAFDPDAHEFLEGAWVGKVLPLPTGSATWKFKAPAGPAPYDLSSTERAAALGKRANLLPLDDGFMVEGKMASGEFIDTTIGIDFVQARIGEDLLALAESQPKINYDETGISQVEASVRGSLLVAASAPYNILDPASIVVTPPKLDDISSTDRQARLLPNVTFSARLTGAIHDITIQGNVSF